jgi:hypothetical protein
VPASFGLAKAAGTRKAEREQDGELSAVIELSRLFCPRIADKDGLQAHVFSCLLAG